MTLTDNELNLLARVNDADGRLAASALDDTEQKTAGQLVYLCYLARVGVELVLTPAGAQALNHNHP